MGMKIKYSLTFSPDFQEWPRRTFNKGVEKANAAIGKLIYRSFIPKHFTPGGAREYGYQKRKQGYQEWKKHRKAQLIPLIGPSFTTKRNDVHRGGATRRQVLRAGLVRATPKRMTLKMGAPSYIKNRGKSGNEPDKVKELTTISKREEKRIFAMYKKIISRFLIDEPKKKRTRTR
jgi:hypothetical protein